MACLYQTGELNCDVIKPLNTYLIKLRVKHNRTNLIRKLKVNSSSQKQSIAQLLTIMQGLLK